MSYNSRNWRAPDCPGCGKPDAARVGNTRWGHDISCCGDACGEQVASALSAAHTAADFGFFERMLIHARESMARLERAAIDQARAAKLAADAWVIEKRAEEIYLGFERIQHAKPEWVPGGNSDMQEEARRMARAEFATRGQEMRARFENSLKATVAAPEGER